MPGINVFQWTFFLLGSAGIVFISRHSLLQPRAHGFYRFFAWEILLGMFQLNADGWFRDPLVWYQLVSWALLIISLGFVIEGLRLLWEIGKQNAERKDAMLLGLEKTSQLVTVGLYRHIRHPMYSSLIFLSCGIFFKSPSWQDAGFALLCSLFLIATARIEERENINFFGAEYVEYMRRSKMFIPFVF